jgi:Tryptophan synthase alpha chain
MYHSLRLYFVWFLLLLAASSILALPATTPLSHKTLRPQPPLKLSASTTDTGSNVASTTMERGVGGRIEDAFAAAKERGEAAFITFVTAGYPSAKGTSKAIAPSATKKGESCTRWKGRND